MRTTTIAAAALLALAACDPVAGLPDALGVSDLGPVPSVAFACWPCPDDAARTCCRCNPCADPSRTIECSGDVACCVSGQCAVAAP